MTYIQFSSSSSSPSVSTSYSPIRQSPLSQPPISASRTPSPSLHLHNGSKPIPTLTRRSSNPTKGSISPLTSLVSPSPRYGDGISQHRYPSSFHQHRSSSTSLSHSHSPPSPNTGTAGSTSPSPSRRLSRSQPLLGSYHLSLLHSRMSSAHAPHQLSNEFSLSLVSIGKGKSCPPQLRFPGAVEVPFSAVYYDLEDPEVAAPDCTRGKAMQSPWTGGVDLEKYYYDSFSNWKNNDGLDGIALNVSTPSRSTRQYEPPSFPGYQVSPVGQLQILIKSSDSPVKVFLIPYDLRRIPIGGRLLVREKTYCKAGHGMAEDGDGEKGILKYAIQLQFVCIPSITPLNTRQRHATSLPPTPSHTQEARSYYVSKSMKVVFVSTPPGSRETMEVERADEIVEPPPLTATEDVSGTKRRRRSSLAFSPGSLGKTSEEWEMVRMKWFARREMEGAQDGNNGMRDRGDGKASKRDSNLDLDVGVERPRMDRKPSLISTTSPTPTPISSNISLSIGTAPVHLPVDMPRSSLSPIPILSPLPIRSTSNIQTQRSRPSTPISPRPISPHVNGRGPALIWSPTGQRRMRREDGLEEVELSERLRKMGMGEEGK
ncbi:hypothetical protein I302_106639 [Kwoniella bestiolae CBS 10118]|uniref:Atos-like conserved domain-containing protein n=1 Tax=Kwoniella bestiolae CBS 10118 TaxID=1296100 RepID=A0AAJ8KBN6_9TREE